MAFRYWIIEHPTRGQYLGHEDQIRDLSDSNRDRAVFTLDHEALFDEKPHRFYTGLAANFVLRRCPEGCRLIEGRNPA